MTEFSRRTFLQSMSAMAISSARPNIVVVLADDLGYGDLSSYGAQDLRTPNIDALVQSGMRFDHFYANSPVCSPTRAALLSGRYPDLAGVPGVIRTHPENSWGHLSRDAVLLPIPLKAAGYHTAIVGKWHLGLEAPNTPNERGFDFFHGFLGDMMDDYFTHRRHGNNYMRRNGDIIDPEGHATDLFTRWAIDYVNERKRDRRPFFLYLAYNAPHAPIQPPAEWVERVRSRVPGLGEKRAKIAALIEHMDDGIGRFIAALRANGQYENTLFLFVSDNGGDLPAGASCGPLRGGKQDMWEGGIRVPMCAVWPGRIPPGSKSDVVALTMDLYPTICEAAGARTPPAVDGVSLLPLLVGRQAALPERELIWVRREGGMRYLGQDYYAIRRGAWKLLQNTPFEPFQLFDLSQDPQEQTDLAKKERKIYAELTARLMLHVQRAGRVPWQA
jgi:arylsulfatase A-like enzyme